MNTLMHICCAPCANRPIAQLREESCKELGLPSQLEPAREAPAQEAPHES